MTGQLQDMDPEPSDEKTGIGADWSWDDISLIEFFILNIFSTLLTFYCQDSCLVPCFCSTDPCVCLLLWSWVEPELMTYTPVINQPSSATMLTPGPFFHCALHLVHVPTEITGCSLPSQCSCMTFTQVLLESFWTVELAFSPHTYFVDLLNDSEWSE